MKQESTFMKILRRLGFDSIAWSLRRLHVPVKKQDLVLEVGSGANPYFRANVLMDAYESTQERHWTPLIQDRPTVLGFVENLPFRDQSFDFIIASHVLEHSLDPEKFISELMRVGKAGYIEVPHAFMERVTPYYDHRLELLIEQGQLQIWKKPNWVADVLLKKFFTNKPNQVFARELLSKKPFHFHLRLYWQKKIDFKIMNPEVSLSWVSPQSALVGGHALGLVGRLKSAVLKAVRALFSQRDRNKEIRLLDLIRCPSCHQQQGMKLEVDFVLCPRCQCRFSGNAKFIDLIRTAA